MRLAIVVVTVLSACSQPRPRSLGQLGELNLGHKTAPTHDEKVVPSAGPLVIAPCQHACEEQSRAMAMAWEAIVARCEERCTVAGTISNGEQWAAALGTPEQRVAINGTLRIANSSDPADKTKPVGAAIVPEGMASGFWLFGCSDVDDAMDGKSVVAVGQPVSKGVISGAEVAEAGLENCSVALTGPTE